MNSDSDIDGRGWPDRDLDPGLPVLLVTVFDPVEAEIIVAKLRSAGIEAIIRHDALSVVYGLTVDGCGQQDILVRPDDLEEARAALEPASEETGEPSPRDDAGPPEERTS
jgi:hypothetical protein